MSQTDDFLNIRVERDKLNDQMKALAWQIAPEEIKELLCGKDGYLYGKQDMANEWLIKPRRQLNHKMPIEAIMNNEVEIVVTILEQLIHCIYY